MVLKPWGVDWAKYIDKSTGNDGFHLQNFSLKTSLVSCPPGSEAQTDIGTVLKKPSGFEPRVLRGL